MSCKQCFWKVIYLVVLSYGCAFTISFLYVLSYCLLYKQISLNQFFINLALFNFQFLFIFYLKLMNISLFYLSSCVSCSSGSGFDAQYFLDFIAPLKYVKSLTQRKMCQCNKERVLFKCFIIIYSSELVSLGSLLTNTFFLTRYKKIYKGQAPHHIVKYSSINYKMIISLYRNKTFQCSLSKI